MFGKEIETNSYGIVGLGRFGTALANELITMGGDLVVIDQNEEKVRPFREYTENAFVVRNISQAALAETGIQNCDVGIVCIGEHLDISILTTLHLVNLGIPKVISKAKSYEHGLILEKLGAEVVYPERDIAVRLAHRLEAARELDYIQLSEKINISKFRAPKSMIGRMVSEVDIRSDLGLNIIAVENGTEVTQTVVPDYVFREGDVVYVSGSKESIQRLYDLRLKGE